MYATPRWVRRKKLNEKLRQGEYVRLTTTELKAVDQAGKVMKRAKEAWDTVIRDIRLHHDLPETTVLQPVDPAKGIFYPVLQQPVLRDSPSIAPRLVEDKPDAGE